MGEHLRSQSGQDRLEKTLKVASGESSEAWLLKECQPCPGCFVMARRETGCQHLVCRCGCEFCFGCGAPTGWGWLGADCECICGWLCHNSTVNFAAWLRSNPQSTCPWLLNARDDYAMTLAKNSGSNDSCLGTLGFWLWLAGASVPVCMSDELTTNMSCTDSSIVAALPLLEWHDYAPEGDDGFSESDFIDDYADDDLNVLYCGHDDLNAFHGHLRKEIVLVHASDRSVRNASQRSSTRFRREKVQLQEDSAKVELQPSDSGCSRQHRSKQRRQKCDTGKGQCNRELLAFMSSHQ